MCSEKFRKPVSIDGLYYSHGLVCASYPGTVVTLVAIIVIVCSLPFFVTFNGEPNTPKPWRSPWLNYRTTSSGTSTEGMGGVGGGLGGEGPQWIIDNPAHFSGRIPSWFLGLPVAVVQQLYVSVEVNCSSLPELCMRSHYTTSKLAATHLISTLDYVNKICHPVMHPAALNLTHSLTTPESDSTHNHAHQYPVPGVLSPALDSIRIQWGSAGGRNHGNEKENENRKLGHQSLKELLYGGFWEHEHHTSTPSHPSPPSQSHAHSTSRHHTFALTFVLQATRDQFRELCACVDAIKSVWPDPNSGRLSFMKHFFYEPDLSLMDFSPLLSVYCIVFLYISFSVGKIDLVKSKIGLGFTACITVIAALTMSLGICTFFGLSISLSGSEIYPYVVITIGLENILIIVKAVMSTPEELDVKHRIAVGLSKEGWAITRNLLTLASMIVLGIATLNYAMKEFCIIALVGLMCDFFLQLVFFPTVLAIDLRRLELSDLSSAPIPLPDEIERRGPNAQDDSCCPKSLRLATPTRWRSKRVKFAYFLARAKIVSRGLMAFILVCLVAWFSKTETCHRLMTHLFQTDMASLTDAPAAQLQLPLPPPVTPPIHDENILKSMDKTFQSLPTVTVDNLTPPHMQLLNDRGLPTSPNNNVNEDIAPIISDKSKAAATATNERGDSIANSNEHWTDTIVASALNSSDVRVVRLGRDGFGVKCDRGEACWRPMVTTHWPRLLRHFGYVVESRFLTLLPPINLNFQVGFSTAPRPSPGPSPIALILGHPNTIRIAFLVALATIVVSYAVVLLKLYCHRHERYLQSVKIKNPYNKMACLKGHTQDVDCLCVNGGLVVSTSLDGDIRVWDANPMRRRCITVINRSEYCGEPPPEVSSTIHRPAAEGCEANEEHNTPPVTATTMFPPQKGHSRPGSVSDYPVQSSWEHMMKSRSGQTSSTFPHPGSGAEPRGIGGGGSEVISEEQGLRQRHGQVGGVNASHMTSGGEQNLQSRQGHAHHSQNSPPTTPLTSIPRKKHSDNSKSINTAVYSAPLSPHSEEKTPEHQRHSPPAGNNMQVYGLQNARGQSSGGRNFHSQQYAASHGHMTQDHTPPSPRQPPNGYGYDQSPSMMQQQQSYPMAPHPHSFSMNQQPLRTGNTSLTGSRPLGHRRSHSCGHGYGMQAPSSVAMVTHQYSRNSSSSQTSIVVNHFPPNQSEAAPPINMQLPNQPMSAQSQDNLMMSSFISPAHGHAYDHTYSPSSHSSQRMSAPPNSFYPSQNGTQAPNSTYISNNSISTPAANSVSISLLPPQVSRGELTVDIEAQPTPEMLLQSRQPVALSYSNYADSNGFNSGSGMGMSSMSYSYSNSHQGHWSGSQTSLTMSHSSSKTRRTSDSSTNKMPQIQIDSLTSTLVTSSTRTKPTAAINEGGSSSPLRRKRMGHCRHLSLGNNIPRQRPTHARNRSLGSVNFNHILPPSTLSSRHESLGNLSVLSHASSKTGSRISLTSGFLSEAQVPQMPDPENGYDFVQHFNLFSQYTSNMALEYYTARRENSTHQQTTPPVWCMDVWNRIVVVGCGNGQIEAWNADTGSLIFTLNMTNSGVSSIAINSNGVISGHMDGSLNLIGHNGLLRFSVPAHSKPISVLRCYGDQVVTGGYDGVVMVHRLTDMACVNSVFVHKGHITAVTIVEPTGCVSGCSEGHVVHWDIRSGNCVHDLGEFGVEAMKLESTRESTVGLFAENTVVVWDNYTGETLYTLAMDGVCCDFAVLNERYVAACFESHITLYDLENGQKHSEKQLESERGVSFLRHILPLQDGSSVVCSSGKDVHIIPCQLKLKTD